MAKNKRPSWLYVALTILSAVLVLWMTMDRHQGSGASLPETITVTYEDIQHLSTIQDHLNESHKIKQKTNLPRGMALILDDVGYDLAALKRVLKLPYPVAVSVIPNAPYAVQAAEMAHASGHVVMLHLPMEPSNPVYSIQMDDAFLRVGMSQDDVRRIMLDDLARIPYVAGVNNHMGSRLTALETPMRWVMDICHERGLFFVDSRTSKDSVAAKLAREAGLRWGKRRVFLDNSLSMADMEASWQIARHKVSRHIPVIVIAHPHAATLDFLETHVSGSDANRILPLRQLLLSGQGKAARFVASGTLNARPAVGSLHVKTNTN